jgi:gentisate 1,2-dioxygenase
VLSVTIGAGVVVAGSDTAGAAVFGGRVISPAWTYHDHWNKDKTPAIWIDGYDNGYNPNVNINERFPKDNPYEEVKKPAGYGQRTLGLARPVQNVAPFPLPPMRYPWADTQPRCSDARGRRERSLRRHSSYASQPG